MITYRVYLIDPKGRMQLGDSFHGASDREAVSRFQQIDRQGQIAELWQGGRLIGKLPRDKA